MNIDEDAINNKTKAGYVVNEEEGNEDEREDK